MFKKRRSLSKTLLSILLVILLLAAIGFLGYSVGRPIISFFAKDGPKNQVTVEPEKQPERQHEAETKPVTTSPTEEPQPETEPPEPEPEPPIGKRILYVSIPAGAGADYISERVEFARENGYYGISLELLADGGSIKYLTSNELANSAHAVSQSAIPDLKSAADMIINAGLVPYARVSALSDHLASWDKSVCYLFENSTSTWLDNEVSKGGKPWISCFSQAARDYVSSIVKEISDAGFSGIIAGEIEFPPFRNSDLNYVGASVKSASRYEGLIEFSNALQSAVGSDKTYAVELDAQDIVAGRAEVLRNPDELNAQVIYVKYDSAAVGLRIIRTDETEISYSGLSETDKLTVVMRSVSEALSGTGKQIIPAITDAALIPQLVSIGYDEKLILVY